MLDQDKNFYLISLSILITCLHGIVWMFKGEITFKSLLGVIGLKNRFHVALGLFCNRSQKKSICSKSIREHLVTLHMPLSCS